METSQKTLLKMIMNPNVDIQILIENILGFDQLVDDMIDNVKSRDDDLCDEVLKDILAQTSDDFIPM